MSDDMSTNRPSSPTPGWRAADDQSDVADAGDRTRRFWFTFLTGMLLALVSFAICLFFWLKPIQEPFFLTINIANYERDFPPVSFARQDGQRLKRHFEHNRDAESKQKSLFINELAKLDSQAGGRPLVIHLNALARVWEGQVQLLPIDAKADSPASWLPLDTLMDLVGKARGPKLLILDLAHPLTDPKLGILSDRVAEVLEVHLKENPPPFLVFCSCSAGQLSLTSEFLQSSVFAHYLDRALQGEADGFGPSGLKDDRVTAQEAIAFVQARVARWARLSRLQRQQPTLFGAGKDFELVNLQRSFVPEDFKASPSAYPDVLLKGFQVRDRWLEGDAQRLAPRFYQDLETQLMRQEERWRAGLDAESSLRLLEAAQQAEQEFGKLSALSTRPCAELPAFSLGALVPAEKRDPAFVETIQAILERVPTSKSPELLAKVRESLDNTFKEKKDAGSPQKIWTLFEALAHVLEPQESQVRFTLEVSQSLQGKKTTRRYVEIATLQKLADYADRLQDSFLRWRPKAVHQAIKTMNAREAGLAAMSLEPMLVHWVGPLMEKGDTLRRDGEKGLYWRTDAAAWDEATRQLQAAEQEYTQSMRVLATLSRYRRSLDEALAILPGYRPLLSEWPDEDAKAVETWHKLIAETKYLTKFFANKKPKAEGWEDLDKHGDQLEIQVQQLKNLLQQRTERVRKGVAVPEDGKKLIEADASETVEDILALLKSPLIKAPDRTALTEKLHKLGKALQARADQEDPDEPARRRPGWDPFRKALVRAGLAIDILDLINARPPYSLEELSRTVKTPAQLGPIEKALQEVWSKQGSAPGVNDFALLARHSPCRDYTIWLAARYRQEAKYVESPESKETPEIRSFFSNAAREFERLDTSDP